MLAGAGVTAVWGLFYVIAAAIQDIGAVGSNGKPIATSSIVTELIVLALEAVIYVALWVLMARKNQSGRNWARITSSVLFVLWSYQTYVAIGTMALAPVLIVNVVFILAIWVIGLAALFLLWRQDSTAFFRTR